MANGKLLKQTPLPTEKIQKPVSQVEMALILRVEVKSINFTSHLFPKNSN